MNRCTRSRAKAAFAAVIAGLSLLFALGAPAEAQTMARDAPKDVKPGRMVVTAPPQITLNGQPDRLSPGARIRNANNLLVLSGGLVGQELLVVYRRDAAGLVHEAWILTPDEYARLGGIDADSAEGYKRFAELMALIFSLRR